MKVAILSARGFTVRDVDVPAIGPDEVLIRTIACGVCGGDLFAYQTRSTLLDEERRLGHEASGEVVETGSEVTDFSVGDMVTSFAYPAYGEYFVARPAELVKLAPDIDPLFALGEPIACCVHAGDRFGIQPGDSVAIVGCGFMGLICMQLARFQEAGFLCAFDPIEFRRHVAIQMGADVGHDPASTATEDLLNRYGPFEVVIEAAGTQSAVDLSTELVGVHGRIVLVGYHQSNGGMRTINMQQWNYKAIDVRNGHVRRKDEKLEAMRRGMDLLRRGHLVTKPLVRFYDLPDIEIAFRDLDKKAEGLVKAVIRMPSHDK